MEICSYCGKPRKDPEGWHGCNQSMDAKARIEGHIDSITRIAKGVPNTGPMTSEQMRSRADRLKEISTAVRLNNGKVHQGYEEYNG